MKKALKINLSGQIFHIDEDAYEKLKLYLDTISSHFSNVNESTEIISDIEARIAELFKGKMSDENQVITLKEVDEVIKIMGRPEEIAADDQPEQHETRKEHRQNRRLYRDPENAVLGGVCSGLAAYFNIDTLLVRILSIILIFVGGPLTILTYIVLWIAVPRALTAAQRLEMRGEKVTVSNIGKTVKEEYESVKENFKKAKDSDTYKRTEDFFTRFFRVIGILIVAFAKILLAFIALIFVILGIAILFGAFGFIFFGPHFLHIGNGNIDMNFPDLIQPFFNPSNATIFVIAIVMLILIPVLTIIYGIFKLIFRFKGKDKSLGLAALTLWVLSLLTTFGLIYYEGSNFTTSKVVSINKPIDDVTGDTLYLCMNETLPENWEDGKSFEMDRKWLFSQNMKEIIGVVEVDIRKSYDKQYKVQIKKDSRGKDEENAGELANQISYNFNLHNDTLNLDSYFKLPEKSSWRMQKVQIIVSVPEGKAIYLDETTSDYLSDIDNIEGIYDKDMVGQTWIMKQDGLSRNVVK